MEGHSTRKPLPLWVRDHSQGHSSCEWETTPMEGHSPCECETTPTGKPLLIWVWDHSPLGKLPLAAPEGPPLYILPRESDVYAGLEEGAKGEGFAQSPVSLPIVYHLLACLQDPLLTCKTRKTDLFIDQSTCLMDGHSSFWTGKHLSGQVKMLWTKTVYYVSTALCPRTHEYTCLPGNFGLGEIPSCIKP